MAEYVGDVVVPFPHHGGTIPKVLWAVVHTLECDAIDGLGEDLARGYFQNDQVSVHTVSDPGKNVAGLKTDVQGYHAGATANKYGNADEVTGRAAWPRSTWLSGNPRKALERQWIAIARFCVVNGFTPQEIRWLSIAELRTLSVRGCCGHVDLSEAFGESSHWDPGPDYPYDIAMTTIRWYAGVADYWALDPATRPESVPAGGVEGGAQALLSYLDQLLGRF